MKHRNLPAVIKHCGQTAYHDVENHFYACFYVIVPIDVEDIDCHGGTSFGLPEDGDYATEVPGHENIEVPEGYHVLGWDFGHFDDEKLSDEQIITSVKRTLENLECETL